MTEEGIALQMARIVRHEVYREKAVGRTDDVLRMVGCYAGGKR